MDMPAYQSRIVAVTVYNDRARITRRGVAQLEPGLQRLHVAGLPLTLDGDSLRAALMIPQQPEPAEKPRPLARLLGVQLQRVYFVETPVEQIRALETEIETLKDEIAAAETEQARLQHNRAALEALFDQTATFARALAWGKLAVADNVALFSALRDQMAALDAQIQAVERRVRASKRRLAKLESELAGWQKTPRREQYAALIEVDVKNGGEFQFELSYLVRNAGWQPLYDLRLKEEEGRPAALEVSYLAQITQRSGENWDDVSMTLSTARPALAGALPELDPWYIGPATPRPAMAARQMRAADMPLAAPMAAAGEGDVGAYEAAPEAYAAVENTSAAVVYRLPARVHAPSDGAPHKAPIARFTLAPELDYVSAPRRIAAVYRRATIKNDSPYTLLAGQANLFAADEFVGALKVELTPPQGEFELYLGVEDRIKIERELTRREVDRKLIGGRRVMHYAYAIQIENRAPNTIDLTVYDQLPVARHEEIKVRLEKAEPRLAEQSELNILAWRFNLQPDQEQNMRFDFVIETPSEMVVFGLP